jgi:hypothetical protein
LDRVEEVSRWTVFSPDRLREECEQFAFRHSRGIA